MCPLLQCVRRLNQRKRKSFKKRDISSKAKLACFSITDFAISNFDYSDGKNVSFVTVYVKDTL